ncbi:tRNA lysidine(34) synthetase TilS [Salinibacillus xinjiangensis]|uniref:tRNA lysidine(34) synthetase TilS n=1 Tax=Salinibacillus xinjiangensis TaxID=1229268 RepID=UPI00129A4E52|nr:tRNA lysidine(34) synthetase TilS [Salinibacillus xinjiangensis]
MIEEKVLSYCENHHLFKRGDHIYIAVSGGPDSMGLLHFFKTIRDRYQLTLTALTVDHQLRGDESHQDVQYVKEMCQKWSITCVDTSIDVNKYKKDHKLGTQLAARKLRYDFFANEMKKSRSPLLAMAHHGDDQVETMFMQLTRGANPKGIPFKREFSNGWIIRPFLGLTRQEIQMYCDTNEITPRYDPSNEDEVYTRNAFRKKIIPVVKSYNPSIHESLLTVSEFLNEDEQFLFKEAEKILTECVVWDEKEEGQVKLNIKKFMGYARPLQRRAFHLILNYLYKTKEMDFSSTHIESILHIIETGRPNAKVDLPGGLRGIRVYDDFILTFHSISIIPYHKKIHPGDITTLPDGAEIQLEVLYQKERPLEQDPTIFVCDASSIPFPLIVRTRQDGDKMRVRGLGGRKKLKDIFIDEKIPKDQREQWPVITDYNGQLLWVPNLKKGEVEETSNNQKWLRLKVFNQTL